MPGVERVGIQKVDKMITHPIGVVGWGSNSGFQAVNLALQFGAGRILLVGFDYSLEKGTHFFGRHPSPLNNPRQASVDRWRAVLDAQAQTFRDLGVPVINCSPHSRLVEYPRQPLLEALSDARIP